MDSSGLAETARASRVLRMVEPEPEPEPAGDPSDVEDVGMGWSKVTEEDGAVFYWVRAHAVLPQLAMAGMFLRSDCLCL